MSYIRTEPYPDAEKHSLALRVTELEREVTAARTQLAEKESRFERFRKRVADVAYKYAEQNNWCDEINDALRELGLEDFVRNYEREVTLTFVVTVTGEPSWDDAQYRDDALGECSYGTLEEWRVENA